MADSPPAFPQRLCARPLVCKPGLDLGCCLPAARRGKGDATETRFGHPGGTAPPRTQALAAHFCSSSELVNAFLSTHLCLGYK